MSNMTDKAERVLHYLGVRAGEWIGPTCIGQEEFEYAYNIASSKLTHTLKVLVAKGLVERSDCGLYRRVMSNAI